MKAYRILLISIFLSFILLILWPLSGVRTEAWPLEKSQVPQDKHPCPEVKVEYLNPPERSQAMFSEAVRVGHLLILSGQLGRNPETGQLAEGGIEAETKQCLENIKQILEKYGSSMDKVVKVTVMLTDIGEWAKMNSVYTTYFKQNKPARSAFAASGLAGGARVEIECWAVIGTTPPVK